MGLFRPIWMTKKISKDDKAVAAVKQITDQRKLTKIAVNAPRPPVALTAVDGIDDEEILFQFASRNGLYNKHGNSAIKHRAIRRMKNQELLGKLLAETEYTWYEAEIIYNQTEHPPLDWNIRMSGEKAEKALADDVAALSWPRDGDKLKDVIEHAVTESGRKQAVEKVPYEDEKAFFDGLLLSDDTGCTMKKWIAGKLPRDSELLSRRVCPHCGAVDSVKIFDEYRQSIDMFISGARCRHCRKEASWPRGQTPAESEMNDRLSVTLAEFDGIG